MTKRWIILMLVAYGVAWLNYYLASCRIRQNEREIAYLSGSYDEVCRHVERLLRDSKRCR